MHESPFLPEFHPIPGITRDHLDRFQQKRGLVLPEAYVALLEVQNGGSLRNSLFLTEDDNEYSLATLAGIGPDQCRYAGNILAPARRIEDEQGNDISDAVVLLRYEPYHFIALDYRECGPNGEPNVVEICVLEKPTYIYRIADNFQTFYDRLERGEKETYFGFHAVDDVTALLRSLARCLDAEVSDVSGGGYPCYRFHRLDWEEHGFVVLEENIEYATLFEQGWTKDVRAAGLHFAAFPECPWLLSCDVPRGNCQKIAKKLQTCGYSFTLVHEPAIRADHLQLATWAVRRLPFERFIPSALAKCLHRVWPFKLLARLEEVKFKAKNVQDQEFEFDGIIVYWPAALGIGMKGLGIAEEASISKNEYSIHGPHHLLRIDRGELSIQYLARKYHYGKVKAGDRIKVNDHRSIVLNGQPTTPIQVDGALF